MQIGVVDLCRYLIDLALKLSPPLIRIPEFPLNPGIQLGLLRVIQILIRPIQGLGYISEGSDITGILDVGIRILHTDTEGDIIRFILLGKALLVGHLMGCRNGDVKGGD